MSKLQNQVFGNAKHWQNNFVGILLITATLFAVVIAVNRHFPSEGTTSLLWILAAIGIAAIAGWVWLALQVGARTAERALFKTR